MALVKEIRILNGELYYVSVDYSKSKYGDVVSVNKRIVSRFNTDAPQAEFKDGRIINKIKEEEKPKINDNKPVEIITEKVETELNETELDEIETDNEVTEEENMEMNEENLIRKMEDRIDAKERQKLSEIRTQKLEQELAETKSRVDEFGEVVGKTFDNKMNGLASKIDNIASATAMISEVKKRESADEASAKMRQMTHKPVEELIHKHKESDLTCTGNNCGHLLKKIDPHNVKCTGPGCNKEYALIDKETMKKADSYCVNCHTPVISTEVDDCPTCHSKKGMYFDINKNK